MPNDNELLKQVGDSIMQILMVDSLQRMIVLDSLKTKWTAEQFVPKEFVPVSSIIHTLKINNLKHTYYSYDTPENYYTNLYYGSLSDVKDRTKAFSVSNTVGLALREGFNKWAQMGIAAYIYHELRSYTIPYLTDGNLGDKRYNEYDLAVGGEISRTQGKWVHYNVNGRFSFLGDNVGQFLVNGMANVDIPVSKRDTMQVEIKGAISNTRADFYFRHFHSQFSWWDNEDLKNEYKARIEGTLTIPRTRTQLRIGFENLKNYTYYVMKNTLLEDATSTLLPSSYSHDVAVLQSTGNIQVFSA